MSGLSSSLISFIHETGQGSESEAVVFRVDIIWFICSVDGMVNSPHILADGAYSLSSAYSDASLRKVLCFF